MNALKHRPVTSGFDVVIIGCGLTGLHELYRIRQLGLSVRCYDFAGGVGGTWYWNCYPGATFDSESNIYAYGFSGELAQEWNWKHLYSKQPETEAYYNFVADKFDLRRDIQLETKVDRADWVESERRWYLELSTGETVRATWVIAAVGILSATAHYVPDFPGIDDYQGQAFHTSRWPREGIDLSGKRVGIIGTGSTGVQLIPYLAEVAEHLTVFQRTPTYCGPLRNEEISAETQAQWKANHQQTMEACRSNPLGFLHEFDPRRALDVPKEERHALYEELWAKPGFAKWLANFHDITTDAEANEDFSEFIRNKIRERVHDPVVAEKLVPKDQPFGSKRIPMETDYYETYNRANVRLVDLRETPIDRLTEKGIQTAAEEHELDVIIFATGYDAFTGGLTQLEVHGLNGESFRHAFADGPRSYLGMMTKGFPNFFTPIPRAFVNFPRTSEVMVDWIADCISYLERTGVSRIEPTAEAEAAWGDHFESLNRDLLVAQPDVPSWYNGGNIPGKKVKYLLYVGTLPGFRERVQKVADNDYEGFAVERLGSDRVTVP
jgi:cation diffusion facilitator CzcD-associated flavoprotein CzcO